MRSFVTILLTAAVVLGMAAVAQTRVEPAVNVETVRPAVEDITDYVTVYGTVCERQRCPIYPSGPSVIDAIYVKEGETVHCGQVLMALHQSEQSSAAEELRQRIKDSDGVDALAAAELQDVLTDARQNILHPELSACKDYLLYSPIDGEVIRISSGVGESVSGLFSCMVVSDLDDLFVRAKVDENCVRLLSEGQTCLLEVPALSDEVFVSSLSSIAQYATVSHTLLGDDEVKTEIEIEPEPEACAVLKPGYSATVRVATERCTSALLIPYAALGEDEQRHEYVMICQNGRAIQRFVTSGKELRDQIQILSGLEGGEVLILHPEELRHGQAVSPCA